MSLEKPNYFGIIPANVRYSEKVSANAKIFYSELTALATKKGYCYATNDYFMKLYNAGERTVTRWISDLEKCGFLKIEEGKGKNRKIYIAERKCEKRKETTSPKMATNIAKNGYDNLAKNGYQNNTSINNKKNNIVCEEFSQPDKDQKKEPEKKKDKEEKKPNEINLLLDEFRKINPFIEFGNKTERAILQEFLSKFGFEKLKKTIEFVISNRGNPYSPVITKPTELKHKFAKLIAFFEKEKNINNKFQITSVG